MISVLKHIQITIALLKGYGIRKIVISGGNRNIPFSESIVHDSFFECFYHADERTAAYFALGLATKSKETVVLSCTSGTALANYVPAIAEAFYQHVPLLVISADRRPLLLNQNEDQMINQVGIFSNFIKKTVDLPEVHGPHTRWGCRRLVCEAINEVKHHIPGPVHINYRVGDESFKFEEGTLVEPDLGIRLIDGSNDIEIDNLVLELKKYKKIAILCGQSSKLSDSECDSIDLFCERFNAVAIVDGLSNANKLKYKVNIVNFNRAKPRWTENIDIFPDLVIQINGRTTFGVNGRFRANASRFDFWLVNNDGSISDLFRKINKVIECNYQVLFNKLSRHISNERKILTYYETFSREISSIDDFPEMDFSNFYVTKRMVEVIPEGSLLHLGILDSLTQSLLFINKDIECYSNRATWGIDGSLASFLGQAFLHKGLSFIIIGDLSFFYGMNALWTRHVKNNVRVLVNNNNGTSTIEDNAKRFKLDLKVWGNFQGTDHNATVKGWVESLGYKYISASNLESFNTNLPVFMSDSDKPIVFEVFTKNSVNNRVKAITRGYADK